MPVQLRAAVWNAFSEIGDNPTDARNLRNFTSLLKWQDKLKLLRNVVELASQAIPTPVGLPGGTQSLRVFIAPEYLFSESCDQHVMDYETRGHVVEGLTKLSADHPDILLVPGSIAYFKPLVDKKLEKTRSANDPAHVSRPVKYQGLFKVGEEHATYLAHNTAYAFFNGQQVFKYRKRLDCGELNAQDARVAKIMVFATGDRVGTFDFDRLGPTLRIGMEICVDHDQGVLSKGGVGNLDLQLILAASTGMRQNFAVVRDGGVVLFCTANDLSTDGTQRAWQRQAGQLVDLRTANALPPAPAERIDTLTRPELSDFAKKTKKIDKVFESAARKASLNAKSSKEDAKSYAQKELTKFLSARGGIVHFYDATIP